MAISRETHRYLKGLNREQFSLKLYLYYTEAYNEGVNDSEAAVYRRLYDEFGFTDEMIGKLREGVNEDINAINEKYITAEQIFNGLINEENITSLRGK